MEMARNPAAMRELMRSQDRQLSNIEVQIRIGGKGQEGRGRRRRDIIMFNVVLCII